MSRFSDATQKSRRLLHSLLSHLTLASVVALAALILFARFSAEFKENGHLRDFDIGVLAFFRQHRGNPVYFIAEKITWLAGPKPQTTVLALSVLYFAVTRRFWPQAVTMFAAGLGGLALIVGLKTIFHRPRPELVFAPLGYSFPSGHSFFAFVVYGMLAYYLTRTVKSKRRRHLFWGLSVFAIFLVGFSRVVVGEHYPSDVGAGFALAYPWVWACLLLPHLFPQTKIEQETETPPVSPRNENP